MKLTVLNIRGKLVIALDIDGTLALPSGSAIEPNRPLRELVEMIRFLASLGYQILIITGQPLMVAKKMEEFLGVPCIIAPDYGAKIFFPDGEEIWVLNQEERELVTEIRPLLRQVIAQAGGKMDDRPSLGGTNGFFPNEATYVQAQEQWWDQMEKLNLTEFFCKNGCPPACQVKFNPTDFSLNVLPTDLNKGRGIAVLEGLGYVVVVGAGDTATDAWLLEAAKVLGIACGNNRTLKRIVAEKGNKGFSSPLTDGHGLLAGLRIFKNTILNESEHDFLVANLHVARSGLFLN